MGGFAARLLGSVSSRECLDAPAILATESGENRGRIETLTAGDWAYQVTWKRETISKKSQRLMYQ